MRCAPESPGQQAAADAAARPRPLRSGAAVVPGARHNTTTQSEPLLHTWVENNAPILGMVCFECGPCSTVLVLLSSALLHILQCHRMIRAVGFTGRFVLRTWRAPSLLPQTAWQALQWREAATAAVGSRGYKQVCQGAIPRLGAPTLQARVLKAGGYIHSVHCASLPLPRAVGERVMPASGSH